MIRDRRIALAFRATSLLAAVCGFLSMLGAFSGEVRPMTLAYYTMLSNLLAITLFIMLTVRTVIGLRDGIKGDNGYFPRFEMICTVDLTLTVAGFWLLLAPAFFTMAAEYPMWSFENLAVHGITPMLCFLDYVLFTQPRHLRHRDIYYVGIFPVAYLTATTLAGLSGFVYYISETDGAPVRFPYFFSDFDRIGYSSLFYIGAMFAYFLLAGHAFYLVDWRIRKPRDAELQLHPHESNP